ncbi:MAG TPA: thiamine pyrophosphate-binding protein [Candidatus Binatia bacterium]
MKAHIYNHFAEMLVQYGIPQIIGMRVYPEMDLTKIRPINIHHETSAGLMAYGYARISGKPGVITLNRPGTMNVIMALTEAWNSSVPVIVLMEGLAVTSEGRNALYEQDQIGMVKPVAKWIGDITDMSKAPEMLRRAFRMATTGRPGPVVLNIRGMGATFSELHHIDAEPFAEPRFSHYPATRIPPDSQAIEEAASLLARAERPCIVAGGGVNLSRAWNELKALAELGQFPVATTISGKGAFSEKHPLSAGPTGAVVGGRLGRGRVAGKIVKESDVVLLVGSRTNEMATSRWTVPDARSTIIHMDIDPKEIGRNYPTRVGIVADAKLGMEALAQALRKMEYRPKASRAGDIKKLLDLWAKDNAPQENSNAAPIHPARLLREIREFIGPDTILVSDGSSPFMWATSHTFVEAGPTFITPRGTGAIGTGLPMALGAKLAAPDKKVICFEGDGGIMCGVLPELEVAARYRIPIVVVVFNNGAYLLEKNHMKEYALSREMNFLPGLNFANIAREFKCDGIRVERPDEIHGALEKALASPRPVLVDVVLDPDEGFPSQ